MYHFINTSKRNPIRTYSRQNFITNKYISIRERLKDHYAGNPRRLDNTNIVARLIKTLQSYKAGEGLDDLERSIEIRDRAYDIANTFDVTTPSDIGRVQKSHFFGRDEEDIILFISEDLRSLDITKVNWRDLEPIRILCHNFQDLTPAFLDNRQLYGRSFYSIGYNVVAIEPAMLFYMFFQWKKEIWMPAPAGEKPTVRNFISEYVLPSMFDSFVDCSYFNRVFTIFNDGKGSAPDQTVSHPTFTPDITRYVDEGIEFMLNSINRNINAEELLALFVSPTGRSLLRIFDIPDQPHTRQIDWALTISRVSMMAWVVSKLSNRDMSADTELKNKLLRRVRQIKYNNVFPTAFGRDTSIIQDYMDEFIYDKIKK